jgi:hypothetical protein
MMARFRQPILILALLWITGVAAQSNAAEAELYYGTVVDEETGEPLEGAVVTVIWFTKTYIALDTSAYFFHNAREVLVDAEGRFSVNADPGRNWNPFRYMYKYPTVIIFKPGYAPVTPISAIKFLGPEPYERLKQGPLIRLPKLRTRKELRSFSDLGAFLITDNVPIGRIVNLRRAINGQRRQAGLSTFPEP